MALGKLNLKLGIDVSDLDKELGKVERTMSRFGSKMQNVGTTLTQSLTLPIIGLGGASLKAFADMERLEGGLTAIMGSSKDAAIEMEKLRKVAENPGLALPQVVKASASLQSVGMDADKARNVIEQFGNAVARAQGGPAEFAGVVYGLTQISSSTSILAEDLNIVKERLPELNDILLKTFGTNTAEGLRNLNISNTEFIDVITNQLSVLDRANGGLNNSFDNLKDNINASLAELGKTINESLKLEIVFDKVSKKIQELVEKFKSLTPEQQENIVKFGLIAAAVGPLIFILGQFATSISSIITLSRTLIGTFTILSGGTYLVVAAIGALIAYYATTDEGQKSLSKTGLLLSESFNRIKAAFSKTLELLAKLQPLFDVLLFVFGKIAVFTFEVVLSQINAVLSVINFLYDGVIKVLEGLRLIDKQKVEPKVNMGFAPGKPDRPSGAGASWGDDAVTDKTIKQSPEVAALKAKIAALENSIKNASKVKTNVEPKSNTTLDAIKEMQTNKSMMQFESMNINALPSLDLLPAQLKSATAETDRLKESTNAFKDAQIAAATAIQYSQEKMNFLREATKALSIDLKQLIDGTLSDIAVGFGEQLGKALSGAKFEIKALLLPLADAIIQFGKMAIQAGITALAIKKALTLAQAPLAIAAGIALIAIGSAIKNGIATPKLAEGGLAFGPTMATVGDNRNAGVDPEVIAPLSKLKSMMGDMGIGGSLETRISGNDLIILLNRSQKGLSRIQ